VKLDLLLASRTEALVDRRGMRRWLGVLLALACGCDPAVEILGRVVAADGGLPPPTKVELNCTGGSQLSVPRSVQSDAQGRFALRGVGCLPPSCVLSTGEGFRRVEEHLMEWCKKSAPGCAAGSCSAASVTLTLP
jgi:hypothetical protein